MGVPLMAAGCSECMQGWQQGCSLPWWVVCRRVEASHPPSMTVLMGLRDHVSGKPCSPPEDAAAAAEAWQTSHSAAPLPTDRMQVEGMHECVCG